MARSVYVSFSDGSSHVYNNVPEGVTPDQVRQRAEGETGKKATAIQDAARMQQQQARPAPTTRAEAKEQGVPRRSLRDYADLAGRTVMGGIAGGYDALQSVAPTIADMVLPGSGKGVKALPANIASTYATKQADRIGLAKPETATERVASAMGSSGISALMTGPGAGLKTLAQVGLSGALAGLGGQGARELNLGPAGEIVGSLVGGLGPAGLVNTGKGLIGWARAHTGAPEEMAARTLRHAASDPDAVVAALSKPHPARVVGSKQTTAEVAGDEGLAALERDRFTTGIQQRHHQNAQARTNAAVTALPGNTEDLTAAGSRAARREQRLIEADTARQQAAREAAIAKAEGERDTALGAATEDINPIVERETSGETVRGKINTAYDAMKAKVQEAYNHPILQRLKPVKLKEAFVTDLFNKVDKHFGQTSVQAKAELEGILNTIMARQGKALAKGEPVTAQLIANVDSHLADFAGRATMAGSRNQAAFANEVRSLLDGHVLSQLPKRFQTQLAKARALREEQGALFEGAQNPVAQGIAKDQFGRPIVSNAKLPERLVQRGGAGRDVANRLVATVGENASEQAVREELRRLIEEGKLTSKNVGHFNDILERFPNVKAHVKNLHLEEALQSRNIKDVTASHEVKALDDWFSSTPLGRISGTLEGGASTHVSKLLKANEAGPINMLIEQVKKEADPAALAGLRRAFAEHIIKAGGEKVRNMAGEVVPDNNNTMIAIERVLAHSGDVLTPAQRQVLEGVQSELQRVNAVKGLGVLKEEPVVRNLDTPFVAQGARIDRTARFLMKRLSNYKNVNALVEKALLHPEVAERLMSGKLVDRMKRFKRAMRSAAHGTAVGSAPYVNQAIFSQPEGQ